MTTIQKKSLKVGKQVDSNHVDAVIRNYKSKRWIHNSKRIGKEDSLSVWYSIEELEEFISKAKEHGADGIKLYFGAYSDDYSEQPLFAGRQTVVLVATKQKMTEGGVSNKDVYVQNNAGSTILAWNAGAICPPYCGGKGGIMDGDDIGIGLIDQGDDGMLIA
jgi:hypothetical protein